jgi:hypothetical protein
MVRKVIVYHKFKVYGIKIEMWRFGEKNKEICLVQT